MISAVAPFSQKAWIEMRGMGRARIAAGSMHAVVELGQRSAHADQFLGAHDGLGLIRHDLGDLGYATHQLLVSAVHALVDALAGARRVAP